VTERNRLGVNHERGRILWTKSLSHIAVKKNHLHWLGHGLDIST
jgi:hypothetical protein